MHDDDNAGPRARRRMALGVLAALVILAMVIGIPVLLVLESTMDVGAHWP